jgi:hypothetical protein
MAARLSISREDSMEPNSVVVYVTDAVGGKFCWSANRIEYEQAAVKHARWWMRQRQHIGFDGKPVPIARPLKLHVERYFDASAT